MRLSSSGNKTRALRGVCVAITTNLDPGRGTQFLLQSVDHLTGCGTLRILILLSSLAKL